MTEDKQLEEHREALEQQTEIMRDFIEDKTGIPKRRGPVSEETGRVPDMQNHMTAVHNRQD
ncbi:hypothetical protein D3C75_216950 [compost metagenome]